MKVGIVTFHRALNYGAVLQAYALQQFLSELEIENEIIDYRCPFIEEFYRPIKANPIKSPKMFIRELLYYVPNRKKRKKYTSFIGQYLKISNTVGTHSELVNLNTEYDRFIAGSDQVWNLKWSGFDKAFFLDFAEVSKKYSYAASFGFDRIPVEEEKEYKTLLSSFQGISVREKTGKKIVRNLLQRDAIVSIDPTCLIEKSAWEKIAIKPNESGYVLLYTLEKSNQLISYAKKIAARRGKKIICITDAIKKSEEYDCKGFLSPAEFIGLFCNAEYVVTNSFHGLMFSVIFEKQFCIQFQKKSGAPNSRVRDFITEYGLESRVLEEDAFEPQEIDYTIIKDKLNEQRATARKYLLDMCEEKDQKKIKLPNSKSDCCGCRACEKSCPQKAILMVCDEEGFLYPVIDEQKCVGCGLCEKVCVFKKNDFHNNPLATIVAYHNNTTVRSKSRSGGVFVAVSDYILKKHGSIFGVALDERMVAIHDRATTQNERNCFCGSKYVQSDTVDTFINVAEDLIAGKKVLFSGTACQIAGLKSYLLHKNIHTTEDSLVTMDIVCHGVMSPLIWKDNLKKIGNQAKGVISAVDFRDKSFGWDSHIETYVINDCKYHSTEYTSIFYCHNGLRPSCYNCPYASTARISDMTLADAWGVSRTAPEYDSSKGVSFVLINTASGQALFEAVKSELTYKQVSLQKMMQPNLMFPTPEPSDRKKFWKEYEKYGFGYIAKKCVRKQNRIKRINKVKGLAVYLLRVTKLKK